MSKVPAVDRRDFVESCDIDACVAADNKVSSSVESSTVVLFRGFIEPMMPGGHEVGWIH